MPFVHPKWVFMVKSWCKIETARHTCFLFNPGGGRVWWRCRVSLVIGTSNWYWLTVGQGLLSLQQVRVEGECLYFFCFFTFNPVPLSSLSLSLISSSIYSISFLLFSGRWHKMTQKGWPVVKLLTQSIFIQSSSWVITYSANCTVFKTIVTQQIVCKWNTKTCRSMVHQKWLLFLLTPKENKVNIIWDYRNTELSTCPKE